MGRKGFLVILILGLVFGYYFIGSRPIAFGIRHALLSTLNLELGKEDYESLCEGYDGTIDFRGECINLEPPTGVEPNIISATQNEETICQKNGGSWGQFSTACHDECTLKKTESCSQVLTEGCHCPPGTCNWKGGCFAEPTWHNRFVQSEYFSTKMLIFFKKVGWPY